MKIQLHMSSHFGLRAFQSFRWPLFYTLFNAGYSFSEKIPPTYKTEIRRVCEQTYMLAMACPMKRLTVCSFFPPPILVTKFWHVEQNLSWKVSYIKQILRPRAIIHVLKSHQTNFHFKQTQCRWGCFTNTFNTD